MFNEVNRSLTDYLNDVTNGVNAQLNTMTSQSLYDTGDSQPPNIDTIVDESRDREVARRFPPLEQSGNDNPSLSVFIDNVIPFGAFGPTGGSPEVAQSYRDATVTMKVRYYINNPFTEEGIKNAYYYARAVLKTIKAFDRNQTARTRNEIQFRQLQDLNFQPMFQDPDFGGLTWYFELTYIVRDERP